MRFPFMSSSTDNSSEKVKDKPFTKKIAYTETKRGKGARLLLIIVIIATIIFSIPAIIYRLTDPIIGYIENGRAQQVAFSNGKIFLRISSGDANVGYDVYDNTTHTLIGTRDKPTSDFSTIYAEDNIVYGFIQSSNTLHVDYWGGTGSTPTSTSITLNSNPLCVDAQGDYAYVGLQNGSIAIVNVSLVSASNVDLTNCTANVGFENHQVFIAGNYIYATSGSNNEPGPATVVNVTDFTYLGTPQSIFGQINALYVLGNTAYTYNTNSKNLSIFDLSGNPIAPVCVKNLTLSNINTGLEEILVYNSGIQSIALLHAGSTIWVVNVTDATTPAFLGCFRNNMGSGMSEIVNGESYLYTAIQGSSIMILAKDKLWGLILTSNPDSINPFQVLAIVFCSSVFFVPLMTATLFWKRERRKAESNRMEFWIKSSTVNRTGLLLALSWVVLVLLFTLLNIFAFNWIIIVIPVVWGGIFFLLPRISLRRQRTRKQKMIAGADQRTRLLGMIKAEKKLNVKTASEMTGMAEERVKTLIYDLVGEGKLEGDFQGDTFIITSDVNEFIKGLENSFATWEEQAKTGEDKKV